MKFLVVYLVVTMFCAISFAGETQTKKQIECPKIDPVLAQSIAEYRRENKEKFRRPSYSVSDECFNAKK